MRRVCANGGDEYSTPSLCTTRNTSDANAFEQKTLLEVIRVTRVTSTRHPLHTETTKEATGRQIYTTRSLLHHKQQVNAASVLGSSRLEDTNLIKLEILRQETIIT